MAKDSVFKKLERERKPRVHISYNVQVGDAIEDKQLPFVVGVFADLSGQPATPLPGLKDPKRNFVEINRENFDRVLDGASPRLSYQVPNELAKDGSKLGVELKFKEMEDFHPEKIAQQVEPIKKLVEVRQRLSEAVLTMNASETFENMLKSAMKDPDALKQLSQAGTPSADPKKPEGDNG